MKPIRLLAVALATLGLASCTAAPQRPDVAASRAVQAAPRPMFVVAANPLAAEAGMAVLRRGGSAVDAAVAIQAMLTLVEPQSSGLAGGAFINHFEGASGRVVIYDGRETAPAGASEDMFLDANGRAFDYARAVVSGRATGVPGAIAVLAMAHREHGRLAWRGLFGDTERTAREGFVVTPRLARFVNGSFPQMRSGDARTYFTEADGSLIEAGDRLRNPALAAFVARLAAQGPDAFYRGATAERIVARTRAEPLGGTMTLADLAAYTPIRREALCRPWRGYRACVPPPPSSGVGLLQLLGLLERTDIAARGPADPRAWFLFAEASRIMYADRDLYVGDSADVPVTGLLEPAYLDERARLIGEGAGAPPIAGTPAGVVTARAADTTREPAGTSHFVVGDAAGNVVSMTTTVESLFGTGRMVDGMFLNNQMTDFALQPRDAQGRRSVNAPAPGKRPRSSMTPVILIDGEGRFAGAIGSAGGNAILAYVAKSLVAAVDWKLPMQDAVALPNLVARGGAFNGEVEKFAPAVLDGLRLRGVDVRPGRGEDSGVHAVLIRDGRVEGGYDPRREGVTLVEPAPSRFRPPRRAN